MSNTEFIKKLKAILGFNTNGELVFLKNHKETEELKKPLRNFDVGTPAEQYERHNKWCSVNNIFCGSKLCCKCILEWAQMPYKEGMINNKETIADIVSEKRREAQYIRENNDTLIGREEALKLEEEADRIESAYKREQEFVNE